MTQPQGQGFAPATGDGGPEPAGGAGAARAAELRTAYEGLLQIRRLAGAGAGIPAPWELRLMPRAVALVLEAAGFPPSAVDSSGRRSRTGYRVAAGGPGADRVEVTWAGPPGGGAAQEERERLTACAAELERHGWECLLYRGPRGRRFLEVEAPRSAPPDRAGSTGR
ncbi:hypothetical protein [Streptomyces sp. NBC_00091]|uniref:hypothetical protein n=1 Tax=Streptomyces sp. NBC_00091 TaxID=2975648 RepID=UPI00225285EA|nr:hypothetical protein [Streptomyces sp. NBC_00091]MCX5379992.1 hypothetical protein [Streptomyces sp. NBC_00091]